MRTGKRDQTTPDGNNIISAIRARATVLVNQDIPDSFIEQLGKKRIVMLGEASHGTHEYYTWRSRITQRLIKEKGFNFIAVEGDWPDCYKLNRYIKLYDAGDVNARKILHGFNRWPTWMWGNWEVAALAEWIKKHNEGLSREKRTGFYGMDVYSLWESMEYIITYLEKVDPLALETATEAFQCFEPYKKDEGRSYAHASRLVPELCEQEVVSLLEEIQLKLPQFDTDVEHVFSMEQNALIAVNAEQYYRSMVQGGAHSWNVRDKHMMETLNRLLEFHSPDAKAIVWAHNTHIGDARATDMIGDGMYNIGELARTKYGDNNVALVGFGSYHGSVIAGRSWGAPMKETIVPPAIEGSWEAHLHSAGASDKLLAMDEFGDDLFMENHIPHRAIGVVYNPEYEQYGNYVPTILPLRYDAFIYIDHTKALHPLQIDPDNQQVPETYPFGV